MSILTKTIIMFVVTLPLCQLLNAAQESKDEVKLSGALSSSQVKIGDSVWFWITAENHSQSELKNFNVQLNIDATAFSCDPPGTAEACASLTDVIEPGQAVTLKGRLHCLKSTEPSIIGASVSYDSISGKDTVHSKRGVSIGNLIGRSPWQEAFAEYNQLILPLVVLILGAVIAGRQSKVQNEREEISRTWSSMLPISHKLAMRYYMPMVKALLRVEEDIAKEDFMVGDDMAASTKSGRSVYFHLMVFWWRFKRTLDKQGAIYFKNRTGEEIVIGIFGTFRKLYKGVGKERFKVEDRLAAIQKELTTNLEFPEFETVVMSQEPTLFPSSMKTSFDGGWCDFKNWADDKEKRTQGILALSTFRKVLSYEANRPYSQWYNSQENLELLRKERNVVKGLGNTWRERRRYVWYVRRSSREIRSVVPARWW